MHGDGPTPSDGLETSVKYIDRRALYVDYLLFKLDVERCVLSRTPEELIRDATLHLHSEETSLVMEALILLLASQ